MFEALKKIIKKTKGIFILVEDNQPAYVLLPFGEYEKLVDLSQANDEKRMVSGGEKKKELEPSNYQLLEKINRDIELWKAAQPREEVGEIEEKEEGNIKIEEIPY